MITIATLMAGRRYSLNAYLWGLGNIKGDYQYVCLTNSDNKDFKDEVKRRVDGRLFESGIRLSRNAFAEKGEHTQEHAEVIAALYNELYEKIDTDYFLFLEDDVIAPSNALKGLMECYDDDTGYACGVQMCRHNNGIFVWDLKKKNTFGEQDTCQETQYYAEDIRNPYGIQDIGLGHFGLTLLRKSVCDKLEKPIFKPRLDKPLAGALTGCDIVMCLELHMLGYKRKCNYDVRALHMDTKGKIH